MQFIKKISLLGTVSLVALVMVGGVATAGTQYRYKGCSNISTGKQLVVPPSQCATKYKCAQGSDIQKSHIISHNGKQCSSFHNGAGTNKFRSFLGKASQLTQCYAPLYTNQFISCVYEPLVQPGKK